MTPRTLPRNGCPPAEPIRRRVYRFLPTIARIPLPIAVRMRISGSNFAKLMQKLWHDATRIVVIACGLESFRRESPSQLGIGGQAHQGASKGRITRFVNH